MNGSLLSDAFGHHVWATRRLLDSCAGLTGEQLEAAAPGTFGSILGTLRHLVGSDAWYLHVLTGGRVETIPDEEMDVAALRDAMDRLGEEWRELLAGDLDPAADVSVTRPDGTVSFAPLGIRLAQAVHHGTDHRSQVCTTLTTLGIDPPPIDVWDFAADGGRLREEHPE